MISAGFLQPHRVPLKCVYLDCQSTRNQTTICSVESAFVVGGGGHFEFYVNFHEEYPFMWRSLSFRPGILLVAWFE